MNHAQMEISLRKKNHVFIHSFMNHHHFPHGKNQATKRCSCLVSEVFGGFQSLPPQNVYGKLGKPKPGCLYVDFPGKYQVERGRLVVLL